MVSSASEGTASHAEGRGLQRDSLPTQGQGESRILACGFSTLAEQRLQGLLSTCLSGSQPLSRAGEHWPACPSIMTTGSPLPHNRKKGPGGCQARVGGALGPPLQGGVESPPLSRPQAPPKLTLSFKQENFLPESYRPYLHKPRERTPLAFLVKGVSLPAQWST